MQICMFFVLSVYVNGKYISQTVESVEQPRHAAQPAHLRRGSDSW